MLEKLKFYGQHSFDDLKVHPIRTLFVLICIGVGVASIIALQNMGVMIEDAFLGNLQARNRGDVALQVIQRFSEESFAEGPNGSNSYESKIAKGVRQGTVEEVQVDPGSESEDGVLTIKMVSVLQDWGDENYDGKFEVNYFSQAGGDPIGIIFGRAPGALMTNQRNDQVALQQTAILIDPKSYPFYSEVLTIGDNKNIAGLLENPRNIVVSQKTATRLDAEVGDMVRLVKFEGEFKIAGIIEDATEVRGFEFDLIMGIFGYYYMNADAMTQFSDEPLRPTGVYVKIDKPEQAATVANQITQEFPYLSAKTTADLEEVNEEISHSINQILSAIGILSLLLGSIGIVNTMQVIVRKRMLEVAVLKTIGLKGKQITLLFLVEALILGILGSIVGVLMGTAATVLMQDVGERLTRQSLAFHVTPMPIIAGVIVGVMVTTVFGFLPTLSAAKVRPAMVIRPQETIKLRSGCIPIILCLGLMIGVLTLIVYQMVDVPIYIAFGFVIGTFLSSAILFPILWVLIWFVGRLFPSARSTELSLAKTELRINRSRNAFVLLALVIGIFSLSSILLFADAMTSLLNGLLEEVSGGRTVIASVGNVDDADDVAQIIGDNRYVDEYAESRSYGTRFNRLEMQNGRVIERAEVEEIVNPEGNINFNGEGDPRDPDNPENPVPVPDFDPADQYAYDLYYNMLSARALDPRLPDLESRGLEQGRMLNQSDVELPGIIVRQNEWITDLGVQLGDKITLDFYLDSNEDENLPSQTYVIVGIYERFTDGFNMGSNDGIYVLIPTVPASAAPNETLFSIKMPEDKVGSLQADLQAYPTVFVIDTRIFSQLIDALLGQITVFPLLFGILGLITGGVVIANSVSLSTMERRRDIAVLKAIGFKRIRVLLMILAENALLGFVGALWGVGFGVVSLVAFEYFNEGIDIDINWTIAIVMGLLSIGVAVLAALVSAFRASGEKPLNVLRYE